MNDVGFSFLPVSSFGWDCGLFSCHAASMASDTSTTLHETSTSYPLTDKRVEKMSMGSSIRVFTDKLSFCSGISHGFRIQHTRVEVGSFFVVEF